MTNREWLLNKMQNMSDEELIKIDIGRFICKGIKGSNCKGGFCVNCKLNWLKSAHKEKITLSEAERIILENIPEDYKWIARNKSKRINVFCFEPTKQHGSTWVGGYSKDFDVFAHLFQFITWEDEQPYNIEELLKCGD